MRYLIMIFVLAALCNVFAAESLCADYKVLSDELKVYEYPNFNSKVCKIFKKGTVLKDLTPRHEGNGWIHVIFDDWQGYIRFSNIYPCKEIKNKTWYPPRHAFICDVEEIKAEADARRQELEQIPPRILLYSEEQIKRIPSMKHLGLIAAIQLLLFFLLTNHSVRNRYFLITIFILFIVIPPLLYILYFKSDPFPYWFFDRNILSFLGIIIAGLVLFLVGHIFGFFAGSGLRMLFKWSNVIMSIAGIVSGALYAYLIYNLISDLWWENHGVVAVIFGCIAVGSLVKSFASNYGWQDYE